MRYTLCICFILFCLLSCRKEVESDDLSFISKPVVNGILIPDSLIKLQVSMTCGIKQKNIEMVENATISLYENNVYVENLQNIGNGIYYSTKKVEAEKKYDCKIEIPNYNVVYCSEIVPLSIPCTEIVHIKNSGINQEGDQYSSIKFLFANNREKKQYFEVRIKLLKPSYYRESTGYAQLEKITDPILLKEGIPLALFSNENISNASYTMIINYSTGSYSSDGMTLFPLIVEFRTVSKSYYQYSQQLYLYQKGRYNNGINNITSAFPLYSNIINGSGIFAGYSVFYSDTIFP